MTAAKTVKTCGLMDLKVGQLGRVVVDEFNDHLIYRRTKYAPPYGNWRFTDLTTGQCWDEPPGCKEVIVEPLPIGTKLISREDGRFAVELPAAPVVKSLEWTDLKRGDYFTDEEGDLGFKTDEGGVVWLTVSGGTPGLTFSQVCGKFTRISTSKAAEIIAGTSVGNTTE